MLKYRDQAEGLRRIMAKSAPRIISLLSVAGTTTHPCLTNLAASLVSPSQRILLIQARNRSADSPSLQAVADHQATLSMAIQRHPLGFDVTGLIENNPITPALSGNLKQALDSIVSHLADNYDTVMIEALLDTHDELLLPLMAQHALVLHLPRSERAIKAAYSAIKRICLRYGQQPVSVLVEGANPAQGQQYFMRLNQVCQQFLGVSLQFLGAIPEDDALQQSNRLGRSVLDAFPKAQATLAFKAIAKRLDKHQTGTTSLAVA